MKKVVLSLAVLFSVAMVACNNNKTTEATDTPEITAEEEVVTDSANGTQEVAAEEVVAEEAPKADAAKEEVKEEAPKADAAAPAETPKEEAKPEAGK